MRRAIILILITAAFNLRVHGQSVKDTLVTGKKYHFIEYYPNGKLMILGNYTDSNKTGNWIYYQSDGTKRANGNYKNGHKVGRWKYYSSNQKRITKWNYKIDWRENITFDSTGNLIIYDYVYIKPCKSIYLNGVPIMHARLM